jgi:hypothetical protein
MLVAAVCTAVSVTTKSTEGLTVVLALLLAVPPVAAVTDGEAVNTVPGAAVGGVLTVTGIVTLAPGAIPELSVHRTSDGEDT